VLSLRARSVARGGRGGGADGFASGGGAAATGNARCGSIGNADADSSGGGDATWNVCWHWRQRTVRPSKAGE